MSTHNQVVFANLSDDVLGQLEHACDVAVNGDIESVAAMACLEVPRFVAGLRVLLEEHVPDANGYCQRCTAGRWWRRTHVPCRVYLEYRLASGAHDRDPVRSPRHRARDVRESRA